LSIVLFGPPGAGKGTQAKKIIEEKDYLHISTGDLFREAMKNETPLGLEAKSYVDSGNLVPDTVTIGLVKEVLQKNPEGQFIFDGFPRTSPQAEALDELVNDMGATPIKHALFLEVPKETLTKRLTGRRVCRDCGAVYHVDANPPSTDGVCDKCGGTDIYQRKDDSEEVISTRLDAYMKNTEPLKDYYQKKGLFVEIAGQGDPKDVYALFQPYL
jgi:adenylate kinase